MKHFRTTAIAALMLGAGSAHASVGADRFEDVAIPAQAVSVGAEIEVIRHGRTNLLQVDRITLSESRVTIEAVDELGEPSLLEIEA